MSHHPDVFTGTERVLRPRLRGEPGPHLVARLSTASSPNSRPAGGSPTWAAAWAPRPCCLRRHFRRPPSSAPTSHGESIDLARKRAADAGVADRTSFAVASAQTFTGTGYDLGDNLRLPARHGRPVGRRPAHLRSPYPDGTWLIVEPNAGETLTDNLNPVGRLSYGFSTFLCVPNALSQPGGYALGGQAGEAAIRQVVTDGGFTRFRRAAGTPFNVVYEARP